MKHVIGRYILIFSLAAAGWLWNGEIGPTSNGCLVATAEAVVVAGVARRSTVGAGAPGVGVAPANRGGPVNRVGVR
jgi:hypothetical protein